MIVRCPVQVVVRMKNFWRSIVDIFMRKRSHAIHGLSIKRQDHAHVVVAVILATQIKDQGITGRYDKAGWPDLNIQTHRLARTQGLLFVVRVPGPMRQGSPRVGLAM